MSLIGIGMFGGAAITDAWSEHDQNTQLDKPHPYWVVTEVKYENDVVAPTDIAVGAEIGGRSRLAGGACYNFILSTVEPLAKGPAAESGEIWAHISGPVWLPQPSDNIRTRCDPGPQLDYETKIKQIVAQANRWEWNGTEFRVFGEAGYELAFVDLLQQD